MWVIAAINAVFYLYLVWVTLSFYRNALGMERLFLACWLGTCLLMPLQQVVSPQGATVIQWAKLAVALTAFVIAAAIFAKGPPPIERATT
jgi:hypothetical protein